MQELSRSGDELRSVHLVTDTKITTAIEASDELRRQKPPELTDAVIVGYTRDSENRFRFHAWRQGRELDFVLACP